jgi:coenzyme PQQ synthesis protein D (PqqD)
MQSPADPDSFIPHPNANVIVQDVLGELLVYDLKRDIVRRLNRVAAAIWKQCDGRKNVAEIARAVAPQYEGLDEQVVRLALHRFSRAHLLDGRMSEVARRKGVSRREWIKRIGIGSLPLVTSMAVPTSAQAASCFPLGHSCSSNAQCCSANCIVVGGLGLVCA